MSWNSFRLLAACGIALMSPGASPLAAATGPEAAAAQRARLDAVCANPAKPIMHLAVIDDSSGSFQCLGLVMDGETITAIRVETHSPAKARGRADADQVTVAEFPAASLESGHGAVLDGVPGHDAITLQGHLSTPPRNAELVISYLYNGITDEFRSCPIRLDRAAGSGWRLVNRFDHVVSHIVVRTREIPLLGMFGIAELEGACS